MIRIALSEVMGKKRVTQAELSRATRIRSNAINDLYHETTERINLSKLDKICEALHCNLSEILIFTPNDERTVDDAHTTVVYKSKNN